MRKKADTTYLGINLPNSINEKLKLASEELGVPKTSIVILAINQYLTTNETLKTLKETVALIEKEKN